MRLRSIKNRLKVNNAPFLYDIMILQSRDTCSILLLQLFIKVVIYFTLGVQILTKYYDNHIISIIYHFYIELVGTSNIISSHYRLSCFRTQERVRMTNMSKMIYTMPCRTSCHY